MSSVSGAAAGNPSGMTSASRTHPHQHHWFTEPTEPAKKSYVFWLIVTQFVFFVALLGPAIVGIGAKILELQQSGAISANGANAASAVLGGWGALFATIANVVFGRLSDRTTSRWGRRRIWVVLGTVIMTVGFVVMATGNSLALATQLGATPFEFKGADVVSTIAAFAREYGITQVLVGRTLQPWYRRWFGPSFLDRLVLAVEGADVIVAGHF